MFFLAGISLENVYGTSPSVEILQLLTGWLPLLRGWKTSNSRSSVGRSLRLGLLILRLCARVFLSWDSTRVLVTFCSRNPGHGNIRRRMRITYPIRCCLAKTKNQPEEAAVVCNINFYTQATIYTNVGQHMETHAIWPSSFGY